MLKKILLIQNDSKIRETIKTFLKDKYEVILADRDKARRKDVESYGAELIIADIDEERDLGFSLLRSLKEVHPPIPSILIVHKQFDETVLRAIELGVFDFIAEPVTKDDLLQTIKRAEYLYNYHRMKSEFPHLVTALSIKIEFRSDEFHLDDIQKVFQDTLLDYSRITSQDFLTIWLGVEEALLNAHEHGNLELESGWKDELSKGHEFSKFEEMKKVRLLQPHYAARKVSLKMSVENGELEIVIEDGGPGFKDRAISQEITHKVYGRGLTIIDNIMDRIEFNEKGNKISLYKRFAYI